MLFRSIQISLKLVLPIVLNMLPPVVCRWRKKEEEMNLEAVTIQDCLDMYEKKGYATVIDDDRISFFTKEG